MLQIAAYRGKSLVSKLIRWQTRSVYSHIAVHFTEDVWVERGHGSRLIAAGSVIEAWKGGVRLAKSLSDAHEPGTVVDLFNYHEPLTPAEEMIGAEFLLSQLGKDYDYAAIVRFLTREPAERWEVNRKTKWFCSELAFEMSLVMSRNLLERCAAWEIPPRDVPRSPILKFDRTEVTT
jgi:uncharacterized protein YycO